MDGLQKAGVDVSEQDLIDLCSSPDENRFELKDRKIRARYGHSISVTYPTDGQDSPSVLFHGTSIESVGSILGERLGLIPAGRQYVHLAESYESAKQTAGRRGSPAILSIDANGLRQEGIKLIYAHQKMCGSLKGFLSNSFRLLKKIPNEFRVSKS